MISVIIVAHHYKYLDRMKIVIESVLKNAGNDVEVIITTDNEKVLDTLNENLNKRVKIIIAKSDKFENNLGFYRNIGVKYSKGEYLYFTDADIVIYKPNYLKTLKRISKESDGSVLVWPKMFRLDENIEEFGNDFSSKKMINFFFDDHHCMYRYSDGKFYKVPELKTDFDGVPYVCKHKDYNSFKEANFKDFEELVWRPFVHWGGIFCKKEYFEDVGGFSLEYFTWGCEDDDLIRRLSKRYNIIFLFEENPDLSVLHLEHPRKYWTSYKRNMQIFEKRKKKEISRLICEDKKRYDSISTDSVYLIGGDKV